MAELPQRVTRFYSNIDYALESIGFKEIIFLHREKLNDPFDPHFSFTTDFGENYTGLIDSVQRHHANDLQKFREHLPQKNWESFVDERKRYYNSLWNNTFVFSASAPDEGKHPKDNLYMWGHYGNGHRGIAIEFDTRLLEKAVLAKNERLGGEEAPVDGPWFAINYTATLPKITGESIFQFVVNRDKTELFETMKLMARSKSMHWKPENEWRLMWHNDETKLRTQRLDLLDDTITAVHLGCLVTNELKNRLAFETKRKFPNAEVFEGKQATQDLALIFEQFP